MHKLLHWSAAIVHTISWLVIIVNYTSVLERNIYVQETTFEKNALLKTKNKSITKQDTIMWIFFNEVLTALSHYISIGYYFFYDKRPLKDNTNHNFELVRRTVEYSVTSGILQVALVLGVSDIALHDAIFIFVINAVIQMLGYYIEKIMEKSMDMKDIGSRLFFPAFVLLGAEIAYVNILLYNVDSSGFTNSIFYSLIGITYTLFYMAFGLVKLVDIDKNIEDEIYIILSVTCKISLSWLLISNTYSRYFELCDDSEVCASLKKNIFFRNWVGWQIVFILFGLVGLVWSEVLIGDKKRIKRRNYSKV